MLSTVSFALSACIISVLVFMPSGTGAITFDWNSVGLYQNGVGDERVFNHRYTPNSRRTEKTDDIKYIIFTEREDVGKGPPLHLVELNYTTIKF